MQRDPVDGVPLPAYYQDPVTGEQPAITATRQLFQANFLSSGLAAIAAPDIAATATKTNLTSYKALQLLGNTDFVPPSQCAYEAVGTTFPRGSPNDQVPLDNAAPDFQSQLSSVMTNTVNPQIRWTPQLTLQEMLTRAGQMQCGQCHEPAEQDYGPSSTGGIVLFPDSDSFVHISEPQSTQPGGGVLSAYFEAVMNYRYNNLQAIFKGASAETTQPAAATSPTTLLTRVLKRIRDLCPAPCCRPL